MGIYQNGTLADSTPVLVNIGGQAAPMTATLNSAAAGRKIRVSSNGETGSYYDVTYDGSTATMVNVGILAPLRVVEFTGEAGDKWEIR